MLGFPATLIAVEGGDGSGKSGAARAIVAGLQAHGVDVLATREPGGTPQGEAIRALILSGDDATWDPKSELLLMTAARVQHVRRVIAPALTQGRVVVSDRFVGSTLAYQGAGRGISNIFIKHLHEETVGPVWPDLTVILDLDAGLGLRRSRSRLADAVVDEGRFEGLELAFHQRIRQSFLDQAAAAPARHVVIDASGTMEAVQAAALDAVMAYFST